MDLLSGPRSGTFLCVYHHTCCYWNVVSDTEPRVCARMWLTSVTITLFVAFPQWRLFFFLGFFFFRSTPPRICGEVINLGTSSGFLVCVHLVGLITFPCSLTPALLFLCGGDEQLEERNKSLSNAPLCCDFSQQNAAFLTAGLQYYDYISETLGFNLN